MPSAAALTRGGFFYKRGDSDTYDTIISAQHILKSMADSHAAQLSALQLQLEPSKQLLAASPTAEAAGGTAAAAAAAGSGSSVVAAAAGKGKGEGKKGKKGAGAAAAGDVEGSLMQLVMTGLSTDEDVSGGGVVRAHVCSFGGGAVGKEGGTGSQSGCCLLSLIMGLVLTRRGCSPCLILSFEVGE